MNQKDRNKLEEEMAEKEIAIRILKKEIEQMKEKYKWLQTKKDELQLNWIIQILELIIKRLEDELWETEELAESGEVAIKI